MLRVYLVETLHGWQAVFGKQVLCHYRTKELVRKFARMEMAARGFSPNRVSFV